MIMSSLSVNNFRGINVCRYIAVLKSSSTRNECLLFTCPVLPLANTLMEMLSCYPIFMWLRQQFDIIDAFVRESVIIPQEHPSKWPYRNHCCKPIKEDDAFSVL